MNLKTHDTLSQNNVAPAGCDRSLSELSLCPFPGKVWETGLKEALYEVGWIKQANDGMIIAPGAKGLLALDNQSGAIVWHNKELKAKKEGVSLRFASDNGSFMNIRDYSAVRF